MADGYEKPTRVESNLSGGAEKAIKRTSAQFHSTSFSLCLQDIKEALFKLEWVLLLSLQS